MPATARQLRLHPGVGAFLAFPLKERLRALPEWLALVVAASGWAAFALLAGGLFGVTGDGTAGAGSGLWNGGAHHVTEPPPGASNATSPTGIRQPAQSFAFALAIWVTMCIAMMIPTATHPTRYVAFASQIDRRQRVVVFFLAGFLAAWLPLGVGIAIVASLLPRVTGLGAITLLVGAALWEITGFKRRALFRCHRTAPIRFRGRAAYRSAMSYGLRNGRSCTIACGPAMVAVMLIGHPVVLTVGVAAAMFAEKFLTKGQRLTPWIAAAGLFAAAVAAPVGWTT
jgi:predicted metal-binding membrane protein